MTGGPTTSFSRWANDDGCRWRIWATYSMHNVLDSGDCTWTSRTVIKLYLESSLWTWPIFFEISQFTGTRGHAYKLYKPRSDCTVRMNFFANRVINAWNNYLPTSVSFTSLPGFSRTAKSVDFRNFWNVIVVNLKRSCCSFLSLAVRFTLRYNCFICTCHSEQMNEWMNEWT